MSVISRFFGIAIAIYWKDHSPPHFHARYGDEEAVIEIKSGKTAGYISKRALSLIQEWRKLHRQELLEDWERDQEGKPLNKIKPLE